MPMKTSPFAKLIIASVISSFVLAMPVFSVHALSVTVDTKSKTTTEEEASPDLTEAKEKAADTGNKAKNWAISVYEKIDAWRVKQHDVWLAIKAEKRQQIEDKTNALDDHRDERVEKVLDEEQTSLVQGSGDEIKGSGNVFLLKLYAGLLSVLTFIFASRLVFYAILVLLVIAILSRLWNMIRGRSTGV